MTHELAAIAAVLLATASNRDIFDREAVIGAWVALGFYLIGVVLMVYGIA